MKETIPEEVNVARDRETSRENLVNDQPLIEVEETLHLSPPEMKDYERCTRTAKRRGDIEPPSCKFIRGRREIVALASFPGSGNTWVRGLLQKASGYCTGSLYCDTDLRRHGFSGEAVAGPAVLVVKTHKADGTFKHNWSTNQSSRIKFSSAILIVRDPFFALVSERHRTAFVHKPRPGSVQDPMSKHTSSIGARFFGEGLW